MATELCSCPAAPIRVNRRNHNVSITLIGSTAQRVLENRMQGEVLAAFKRSFYIVSDKDELACVGTPSLEAGPLNAIGTAPGYMDWSANGLQPGARAYVGEDTLYIGRNLTFTLVAARLWQPPAVAPSWQVIDLSCNLTSLEAQTRPYLPSEGLARLIPNLARGEPLHERDTGNHELCVKAASEGITTLQQWARSRLSRAQTGARYPPTKASVLIGLGPGLTPSGDDFIAGFLIALRALGRGLVADDLGSWARRLAQTQTGMISLAHIACAAEGQGADALHRILAVLPQPGSPNLSPYLKDIAAIGHTSGWDAMAGEIASCESIVCTTSG